MNRQTVLVLVIGEYRDASAFFVGLNCTILEKNTNQSSLKF